MIIGYKSFLLAFNPLDLFILKKVRFDLLVEKRC